MLRARRVEATCCALNAGIIYTGTRLHIDEVLFIALQNTEQERTIYAYHMVQLTVHNPKTSLN